jgi:hypothetical protein
MLPACWCALQESTFAVMLQDSSDQLLERLDGLQLRLQVRMCMSLYRHAH